MGKLISEGVVQSSQPCFQKVVSLELVVACQVQFLFVYRIGLLPTFQEIVEIRANE